MNTRSEDDLHIELHQVARLRIGLRRYSAATEAVVRRHRLTPRRYDLLAILHGPDGPSLTASELSGLLALSRNATTELITRAERAGLVARTPDPEDGRVKRIKPTSEGRRRFLACVSEFEPERRGLLRILG